MKRSDNHIVPAFYHSYINAVQEDTLEEALAYSLKRLQSLPVEKWELLHQQSYFPGKWTLNELLQHMIDTERIMSYRALTFARQDLIALPGFEENAYAANSFANDRSIAELTDEMVALRMSTYFLFKGFSPAVLNTVGRANGQEIDVISLGYCIVGHELHHLRVIEERYLPILQ